MKHNDQVTITKAPAGVIVKTKDETFCISYKNAAQMDWNEATKRYCGQLPTRAQAQLICLYNEAINKALTEAGGQTLDCVFWTNAMRNNNEAFCFVGSGEFKWVGNDKKTSWYYIRPITSIENNGKQTICN
jgi:hypothetical protein